VLATDEKKEVGDRRWVECVRYSVRFASVGWFSLSIGQRLTASVRWLPIEQETQESEIQHTRIQRQKRIAA
jgi:hypothetical protein